MLHVGLTGGIASGKSQAARVFAELGAHVIDADKLAHDLMSPGQPAYDEVVACFGRKILNEDGAIQRKALADIVFHDPEALRKLNTIIHPKVMEEEARLTAEYAEKNPLGVVIVDAALLIESCAYTILDKVIVVYCDPNVQLTRLMARDGLSVEQAEARIKSQMPLAEKLKVADYRIDTSGTFKETRVQIEQIYKELLALALLKS